MIFQLGSTLLDACVLAILDRGDTYGYVLTQNVKAIVNFYKTEWNNYKNSLDGIFYGGNGNEQI